jgi:hypothetical protein
MAALLTGAACAAGVTVANGEITGTPAPSPTVDQKVLVVTDGTPWVEATRRKLAAEGVATAVVNLADAGRPFITSSFLSDTVAGTPHAKFDGVVLPNHSAANLTAAEKDALARFQKFFRVLQITGRLDEVSGPDSQGSDIGRCTTGVGECQVAPPASPSIGIAPTPTPAHPCPPVGQSTTPSAPPSPRPTPAESVPVNPPAGMVSSPTCGPDGSAGVLPITPPQCTINATSVSQTKSAKPGDTVCFSGNGLAGSPLNITTSGTMSAPIVYTGDGSTPVKGTGSLPTMSSSRDSTSSAQPLQASSSKDIISPFKIPG